MAKKSTKKADTQPNKFGASRNELTTERPVIKSYADAAKDDDSAD